MTPAALYAVNLIVKSVSRKKILDGFQKRCLAKFLEGWVENSWYALCVMSVCLSYTKMSTVNYLPLLKSLHCVVVCLEWCRL